MKKQFIIHPFVFAFYPLVYLYLANINQVFFRDVLGLLVVVLLAVPSVWVVLNRWIKPLAKSALITSAFFLLFFSFGHFTTAVRTRIRWDALTAFLETRAMQFVLIGVWVLLLALIAFLTIKSRSDFRLITQFMNVVAIGLAAFAIYQTLSHVLQGQQVRQQFVTGDYFQFEFEHSDVPAFTDSANLPDIYYFILDGYGRTDVLNEIYNYDNSEFINFLRKKGFYIAEKSTSNYPMTAQSLSSAFNFAYLDVLNDEYSGLTNDLNPMMFLLIQNRLQRFLKEQGYEMVVFDSGFPVTEVLPADFHPGPSVSLNAYQNQVINLTPLRLLLVNAQYDLHRSRILYAFEHLPDYAHSTSPRFVFAHILLPHPPFVFNADGSSTPIEKAFSINDTGAYIGQEEYVEKYKNQVAFTSQQVQQLVTRLLDQSDSSPIIIFHGDHGPGSMLDWGSLENTNVHERFSILNAYYFPDGNYRSLYPEITPVNSFRVVLNQYFATDYPLLPDRNYFMLLESPYEWLDVTESVGEPSPEQ